MHTRADRAHIRMVRAATPSAIAEVTKPLSASADGWFLRKIGDASPRAGSQSIRNPPAMTERVSAQTMPIWCIVARQYASHHAGGLGCVFHNSAVHSAY
jgi:hypothetical protein